MKRLSAMLGLAVGMLLLLPLAVSANADRDNVEELLDEWIDYFEDEDYTVLDTDVAEVNEDTVMTYTIDLRRGHYVILAQGGDNIEDLNLYGYYEDDYEDGDDPFISDEMDDNLPILEFDVNRSDTFVIVAVGESFARRRDSGYFCILFCKED